MDLTFADRIKILQTKIQVEKDASRKQELNKQLKILNYNKEIEDIRKLIKQLG